MHSSTNFWRKTRSNRGPATCPGQGAVAPQRRACPRAAPARQLASVSTPRADLDRPPAEARSSPCAAPRGSLESSRAARTQWTPPYRHGACPGPPVRRRRPPYERRPRLPCHDRISAVTPSSSRLGRPYLSRVSCPSSRHHRRQPRQPRRRQ
jgi:hypothetical protein